MPDTKQQIIDTARELFFSNGFKAVSLDEISQRVGIKAASLYYHFPKGKEEIFFFVISERLEGYKKKFDKFALESDSLQQFLVKFGTWYCSQKQMNMLVLSEMDMPNLSEKTQQDIMIKTRECLFNPLQKTFGTFSERIKNELETTSVIAYYMTLLGSVLPSMKYRADAKTQEKVEEMTEVLLKGCLLSR